MAKKPSKLGQNHAERYIIHKKITQSITYANWDLALVFLNIDLVSFRQKKIYRFKKKPKSPKKWAKLTLNGLSDGIVYCS